MRPVSVVLLLALTGASVACGSSSSTPACQEMPQPPPPPVTYARAPTHLATESGLCEKWDATPLDLTPLAAGDTLFTHGVRSGFSFATGTFYGSITSWNLAAAAFDGMGRPVGKLTRLPDEPTGFPSDVIGTGDGGWLVAWIDGDPAADDSVPGTLYLVRYDAAGVPVDRSESITAPGLERAMFGAGASGESVVWCMRTGCTVASIPAGSAQLTAIRSFGQWAESLLSFERGVLISFDDGSWDGQTCIDYQATLRTRDRSGTELFSVSVPSPLDTWNFEAFAASADGAGVVIAQENQIGFMSDEGVTLQPTDASLTGAVPFAEAAAGGHAHMLAGFTSTASGGVTTVGIVDVSSSGARGAIGQAVVPPGPDSGCDLCTNYMSIVATTAEDAFAVAFPTSAAVFRCAERAP